VRISDTVTWASADASRVAGWVSPSNGAASVGVSSASLLGAVELDAAELDAAVASPVLADGEVAGSPPPQPASSAAVSSRDGQTAARRITR
jgi:hypothetical protein